MGLVNVDKGGKRAIATCKFESEFALKFDPVYFSAMIFTISQMTSLAACSDVTGRYS